MSRISEYRQTVVELWQFNGFKMAVVRRDGFLKIQFLTAICLLVSV